MKKDDLFIEGSISIEELISSMNEKVVKDQLKGLCNQRYKNSKNAEQKKLKLSQLNMQINEIREILNEVCCTANTSEAVNYRLIISQYLDGLIAEYMKELNYKSKI